MWIREIPDGGNLYLRRIDPNLKESNPVLLKELYIYVRVGVLAKAPTNKRNPLSINRNPRLYPRRTPEKSREITNNRKLEKGSRTRWSAARASSRTGSCQGSGSQSGRCRGRPWRSWAAAWRGLLPPPPRGRAQGPTGRRSARPWSPTSPSRPPAARPYWRGNGIFFRILSSRIWNAFYEKITTK